MVWKVTEGLTCEGKCLSFEVKGKCPHPSVQDNLENLEDADLDYDSFEEYEAFAALQPGESRTTEDGWMRIERLP